MAPSYINDYFFTYIDKGKGPKKLLVKLITDRDWRIYVGQNKYPPIFNPKLPRDMAVFPKDADYEKGYFDRIFIRKAIEKNGVIKEINEERNSLTEKEIYLLQKLANKK